MTFPMEGSYSCDHSEGWKGYSARFQSLHLWLSPCMHLAHPQGSTVALTRLSVLWQERGAFSIPVSSPRNIFFIDSRKKPFLEEKQFTCDIAQCRSCHKASQRSDATRVWLMRGEKKNAVFVTSLQEACSFECLSTLIKNSVSLRDTMINKSFSVSLPGSHKYTNKTLISWTRESSPLWITINGYEGAGSFYSSDSLWILHSKHPFKQEPKHFTYHNMIQLIRNVKKK